MHSEPVDIAVPDNKAVAILLVDEHLIFREGLRKLLEGEPGFTVVGDVPGPDEALQAVATHRPDILITGLPGRALALLMQTLQDRGPQDHPVRTIVLTTTIERPQIAHAMRLGIAGMLLKDTSSQMLFDCVRSIAAGRCWIGREQLTDVAEALLRPAPHKSGFRLTTRERQIVEAVQRGDTNKTIARHLSIAETTVKHHLHNIYTKVGVFSRVQLAIFAITQKSALGHDVVDDAGSEAPAVAKDDRRGDASPALGSAVVQGV